MLASDLEKLLEIEQEKLSCDDMNKFDDMMMGS